MLNYQRVPVNNTWNSHTLCKHFSSKIQVYLRTTDSVVATSPKPLGREEIVGIHWVAIDGYQCICILWLHTDKNTPSWCKTIINHPYVTVMVYTIS